MSERSKGDTSSSLVAPPSSGRVVKNPLLSASVTGLTFDDFQNKPLLLPAAPPIIHQSPVASRESTPLVTVGKSSEIDTENLSEINLNDTSATSSSNLADTSDENSNSLIESTSQIDNSILSQAASSFSQLPSVASSVFSTFSKKFNSSSGRDDFNSNPQLDIQPFTTQFVGQSSVTQQPILPPPSAFGNQHTNQHHQSSAPPPLSQQQAAPPVEPPTFYSPTEIPSAPSGNTCPPPASGQNTYRLSAKKKLYAQIPGLSSSHQESSLPASATVFPPPIGFESLGTPVYTEQTSIEKPEERKGGLFSLSNLGVPNVLQNLSGLVQSATGISQRPQEQQEPFNNFGNNQVGQVPPPDLYLQTNTVNSTGISQAQPPQSAVNFFATPILTPSQSASYFPGQVPPIATGSSELPVAPFPQPPSISGLPFSGPSPKSTTTEAPIASGLPVAPFSQPPPGPSIIGVPFSGPTPKSTTPEAPLLATQQQPQFFQPVVSSPSSRPPSVGNQFAGLPPKTVTLESNHSFKAFATQQPSQPDFNSEKGSSGPSSNLFGPPPTAGFNIAGQPTIGKPSPLIPVSSTQTQSTGVYFVSPPTNTDNPEAYSALRPFVPSQTSFVPPIPSGIPFGVPPLNSFTPETNSSTQLPPQVKPPSAGPPSTSFRLQKGTRLYKSPFAAAPSEYQPQVQIPQNIFPPISEPISYFNPQGFAPTTSQGVFPLKQGFPESTVTQETTLNPVQEASISSPTNISFTQSSFSAPPLNKVTEGPPISEVVNFFNPQGFTPSSSLLDPAKRTAPANILDPSTGAKRISTKPPDLASFSSTNLPPLDKALQPPTAESVNFFNPQLPTPSSDLDTEKVDAPENIREPSPEKTLLSDQIQSSQENYFPSQVPEQSNSPGLKQPSTINTEQEDKQKTEPEAQSETEPEVKQETLTFLPEQQNNILPPPPAATFGIPTPSKETANFPPPPPQHSFQNKPSSNPYRKGLNPQHSQLPAPTSLSSFFTPTDQGNHFFQTIASTITTDVPQSTATFFAETNSAVEREKRVSPAPEVVKAPEELSAQLSEESPKESKPIPSAPPSEKDLPQSGPAQTGATFLIQEPTPVSSVTLEQNKPSSSPELEISPSSPELEINPLKSEAPVKPISPQPIENLVSFYKPDPLPSLSDQQVESSKIASPIDSQETPVPEQQPVQNTFSGFFDQAASTVAAPNPVVVHRPSLPDPTTFFDSFSLVPSLGIAAPPPEDPNSQRIQNFFNNPPPKELDTVGDLNYNLVGSGLSVQNLQIRSLTPASNLAEPPSSSCSEFSELNSSLSAANRQPLIQAADSTKVSPEEEAVFESPEYQDLPEEIVKELKMANSILGNNSPTNEAYKPAVKHWFYKRKLDVKCLWTPFSYHDSALLEDAFLKGDVGPNLVAVEGGRFDVNISERTKTPVYWEGEPIEVKRCSWFFKASDSKYVPYEEEIADLLEEEYKKASESCEWHKKIPISAGDIVVFHGPTVIVHFQPQQQVDSWGGSTQTITRPRVVKRDLDDFNIDEGESHKVDHLLFMVHGIGSACDLKMRSVEEVVDEFRSIALQLVQSHYKNSVESGFVGRVEVLPVSWHSELHSDELGIDEKLKSITLESIPKLRNFTNDTLLDILFYTSPMFCQRIINTVTASMNSIYVKYKQRNPEYQGAVSLAGHSLGSLIMFDLLCHQRPHKEPEEKNMENPDEITSGFPVDSNQLNEEAAKNITYKMGQAGTGQPFISYPQLLFQPKKFFALGSPIGMFVTIRGIDKLGLDFRLPTCPGFYNIFHPYDPVAYRLEALVNPDMNGIPPVLIPHHKGRKRMHLELKETMSRVGADLKQRFFETFKTTLDSVNFLTPKIKNDPKELEKEVDKLLELQSHQEQQGAAVASTSRSRANSNSTNQSDTDVIEIDFPLGKLNDSKRVDYVLQEAPLEFFNEYLFALSSHVCYWESEDTILFVMKQIYSGIGFSPDSQVPQQTLTIERPSSSSSTTQQSPTS